MEAIYTYDAVKVYALALHQILQKQGDICNGTDIVQTIIQMGSYPSDIQGINVRLHILHAITNYFHENFR